jgi:hypothetical protein
LHSVHSPCFFLLIFDMWLNAILLILAVTTQGHCKHSFHCLNHDAEKLTISDHFPKLVINGQVEEKPWNAVRETKHSQDNQGVSDINGPDIRCYQNKPGIATLPIVAGDRLGFAARASINHFGPVSFYMAKVPEGANVNTWEPAGKVWFKVGAIDAIGAPKLTSSPTTWPAYSKIPIPEVLNQVFNSISTKIKKLWILLFLKAYRAVIILFEWKALLCIKLQTLVVRRSILPAARLRSLAVEMAVLVH